MTDARDADIQHGQQTRKAVLGSQNLAAGRSSDPVVPELGALSDEVLWGRIWGRPGLPLSTRSVVTVTALLALERFDYARIHMGGARRLGITREEMAEIVLQLTFYVGLPVVHEGLKIVAEVYNVDLSA